MGEVSAELTNFKLAMKSMEERVSTLEQLCVNADESSDMNKLTQHLDEVENALVSADVIMYNIPQVAEENLTSLFTQLCESINLNPLQFALLFVCVPVAKAPTTQTPLLSL